MIYASKRFCIAVLEVVQLLSKTIEKEKYLFFVEQGLSYVEIAKRFKVSVRTLFLWRKENNFL